jgi:hypothetical protein
MTNLTIHPLTPYAQATDSIGKKMQKGGDGFADMLEMINPLQHLPVVAHFYRNETGSDIPDVAKIIGAGLFGGVLAAAGSAAVSLIEAVSGEPILQAAGLAEGEVNHQPFAKSTLQAVALTPNNGDVAIAISSNFTAAPIVPDVEASTTLRDLRKSQIGLPAASIEAQLRTKLTADLI